MKIKPLHDLVLIKPIKVDVTESGIVLPETARSGLRTGKVIAIGPGTRRENVFCHVSVAVGDVVRYEASFASEIIHEGEKFELVRDADLRCAFTES